MNLRKNIKVSVALSLFLSSTSPAQTIADWNYSENSNGQQTICTAESSDIEYTDNGPKVNTYIRISKAKNSPNSPVEITIHLNDNPRKSTGMVANVRGAPQLAFSDMTGARKVFWSIPKNMNSFIQQLSSGFKIKGVGGKRDEEVQISGNGYRDILNIIQNNCNSGASLVDSGFEQEFFAQIPDAIDPTRIDVNKTTGLRTAYHTAYRLFAEISETKAQLAQLLSKYQTFIDELKANRDSANLIQNTQLPQAQSDLRNAQARQSEARAELAKIEKLIPELTAKIARSQKILDDAKAIVAPLEPEYSRLTQSLSRAQTTLNDSQNRLHYIETRLRDGAQQLLSLRSEADSIERYLPQKRSDMDRALYVYRDAQARRSQYNMSWERDNRLRNNFEYQRLHQDYRSMQQNLRQAEMDTQRLRVERDRVAQQLHMCRTQPIISEILNENIVEAAEPRPPGLRPGQPGDGGGLRPGPRPPGDGGGLKPGPRPPGGGDGGLVPGPRPPAPQPPIPQPPPPQKDCSHLERALMVANNQVAQGEANQRNIAQRMNEISSRINQVERQVDFEVRREYDMLVSREEQTRREYDRIERDVRNDEARLTQIRNSDIPSLENEQRNLSSERPLVIARIEQAQSDVNRLSRELEAFKLANDWDRKVAAVDSAQRQLNSDQANLDSVLSQKRLEQQKLDQNILLAQQAQDRIDSLTAQLTALNNRAAELNELLKNLPAERAPLDEKILNLQTEINKHKSTFASLLN